MSTLPPADTVPSSNGRGPPPASQRTPAPRGSGRLANLRSLRVLIVDDEMKVADFLCAMVCSWGHDGRRAYDAADGLTAARTQSSNVVLLDIAMPGIDGYQLAQQLRREAKLKGCFLIAMRAVADCRGGSPWREADIDLFLSKPMDLEVLAQLLQMEGDRLDRLGRPPLGV